MSKISPTSSKSIWPITTCSIFSRCNDILNTEWKRENICFLYEMDVWQMFGQDLSVSFQLLCWELARGWLPSLATLSMVFICRILCCLVFQLEVLVLFLTSSTQVPCSFLSTSTQRGVINQLLSSSLQVSFEWSVFAVDFFATSYPNHSVKKYWQGHDSWRKKWSLRQETFQGQLGLSPAKKINKKLFQKINKKLFQASLGWVRQTYKRSSLLLLNCRSDKQTALAKKKTERHLRIDKLISLF